MRRLARPMAAGVVAWSALAAAAIAQEPPPDPVPDPAPAPAPDAPAPPAAPTPDAGAPTLDGGTRYASATWGLDLPLPKGTELDAAVPMWAVLTWKLPYGKDGHGYLSAGYSEPGESPRAYRRFLLGGLEGNGFAPVSETTAADLPVGATTALVYRRASDGEMRRVVLWLGPTWSGALVFAHPGATDQAWAAFVAAVLATARVTGPSRGLSARLSGTELAPPALDVDLGVTLRLPKAAKPVVVGTRREGRGWEIPLAYGWTSELWLIRGADGDTTESVLGAFARSGGSGRPVEFLDAKPDAVLGTTGYICMGAAQEGKVWQLYFLEQGGRVWWATLSCRPDAAPVLRPMMARLLLSFRASGSGDPRLAAPEGPTHEAGNVSLQSEPRQVPVRTMKEFGTTMQAAVDTARELLAGPVAGGRIRAHCYTPEEIVRRAGKDAAASGPLAQYLPEGRFILVHVPAGKAPERLTTELQRAAFAAYRDDWLGTPHAMPPWLVAGTEEWLRVPRKPGTPLELDLKRAPLADWIRKNRKTATWPALATLVRARRPLVADVDRAYALACVLALLRAEAPSLRGLPSRFAARLLARGDPDEALEDALDGVDLAAWDAAARALLAELK